MTTSQPRLRPTTIFPAAGSGRKAAGGVRAARRRGHSRRRRVMSPTSTRS
jgi:hypothetical protein